MRTLIQQGDEWKNPQGQMITMCVIEEIGPYKEFSAPAIAVVGGLSACRHHLHIITTDLANGKTIDNILKAARAGAY